MVWLLLATVATARPAKRVEVDAEAVAADLLGRALTTNEAYEELVGGSTQSHMKTDPVSNIQKLFGRT